MQNTTWKTPREEPGRKPRSEYGVELDRGSHPLSKERRRDCISDVGKNQRGNFWMAATSCPLSGFCAQDFARHESCEQDVELCFTLRTRAPRYHARSTRGMKLIRTGNAKIIGPSESESLLRNHRSALVLWCVSEYYVRRISCERDSAESAERGRSDRHQVSPASR